MSEGELENSKDKKEESLKLLMLLRLDSEKLFKRIKGRYREYLMIFSIKRTREHFPKIFKNRYEDLGIDTLKLCGEEVLIELDHFYSDVDELYWYLYSTEDMPAMVEDKVISFIRKMENSYQSLELYLNAELSGMENEEEKRTS